MIIDKRGACYECPFWDGFMNYCYHYNMLLNGQGVEPTCFNLDRIVDDEEDGL